MDCSLSDERRANRDARWKSQCDRDTKRSVVKWKGNKGT